MDTAIKAKVFSLFSSFCDKKYTYKNQVSSLPRKAFNLNQSFKKSNY